LWPTPWMTTSTAPSRRAFSCGATIESCRLHSETTRQSGNGAALSAVSHGFPGRSCAIDRTYAALQKVPPRAEPDARVAQHAVQQQHRHGGGGGGRIPQEPPMEHHPRAGPADRLHLVPEQRDSLAPAEPAICGHRRAETECQREPERGADHRKHERQGDETEGKRPRGRPGRDLLQRPADVTAIEPEQEGAEGERGGHRSGSRDREGPVAGGSAGADAAGTRGRRRPGCPILRQLRGCQRSPCAASQAACAQ
jgi:hypothetical protein